VTSSWLLLSLSVGNVISYHISGDKRCCMVIDDQNFYQADTWHHISSNWKTSVLRQPVNGVRIDFRHSDFSCFLINFRIIWQIFSQSLQVCKGTCLYESFSKWLETMIPNKGWFCHGILADLPESLGKSNREISWKGWTLTVEEMLFFNDSILSSCLVFLRKHHQTARAGTEVQHTFR
jgi:hypothetical protein